MGGLPPETRHVRVVSFSLNWTINMGHVSGPPEQRPSILGGDTANFEAPIRETVERLWATFPSQAEAAGLGLWLGPDGENHPSYLLAGSAPMDKDAWVFPPPRARGYVWPEGFRFLEATPSEVSNLPSAYPGEVLLLVEYRAFVENVGEDTSFEKARYKIGLVGEFTLFSENGELLSRQTLVDYSRDSGTLLGGRVNRGLYADLAVQAQESLVKQWAKRVKVQR